MLAIPGNYILLINNGLVFVPFCIVQFGNKLIFQATVVFGGHVQSEPFLEDLQLVVRLIGEVGQVVEHVGEELFVAGLEVVTLKFLIYESSKQMLEIGFQIELLNSLLSFEQNVDHTPYIFFDTVIHFVGYQKSAVFHQECHQHPDKFEIPIANYA